MATMKTDELLTVFEEMTVLELKEFLDAFEERFDVTAAAPMAVAAAPAAAGDGVPVVAVDDEGRFGWDGGTGTSLWVDPAAGTAGVLLTREGMGGPTPPTWLTRFWGAVRDEPWP